MLLLVCVLECLGLTGLEIHEWLGFALCPLVLVHVVLQWPWFTTQIQKILRTGAYRARINAFLNALLLVLMSGVLVSSALSSDQLTPLTGESFGSVGIWREVHGWLNFTLVTLVGLHLALNWDWTLGVLRRRQPERPAIAGMGCQSPAASADRRSQNVVKILGRSLAMILAVAASAWVIYFVMAPMIRSPRERMEIRGARTVGADVIAQRSQLAPGPRAAAPARGFEQLMVTTGVVVFVVLIGRYVFRLRL